MGVKGQRKGQKFIFVFLQGHNIGQKWFAGTQKSDDSGLQELKIPLAGARKGVMKMVRNTISCRGMKVESQIDRGA